MKRIFILFALAAMATGQMIAANLIVTHATASEFETESENALADAGLAATEVTSLTVVSSNDAEMNVTDFTSLREKFTLVQHIDLSNATLKGNSLPAASDNGTSGALRGLAELATVVLPEGLQSLGAGSFLNCAKLTTVDIPESVTIIGQACFKGCAALQMEEFPLPNATVVNNEIFRDCAEISFSSLPETIKTVGNYAFSGCKKMTASKMPDALETIAESGFASSGVTFSEWNDAIVSIAKGAFSGSKVTFKEWTPNIAELPASIFAYCSTVTDFTIPETISKLPDGAFICNESSILRTFTCRLTTPPAATVKGQDWVDTFGRNSLYKNITFKVLREAVEAYQNTAPYSSMNIVALTTSLPLTIEGEGTVVSELGEAEEGLLPVYEGNNEITLTPGDGMKIGAVTYNDEPVDMEGTTFTLPVSQNPGELKVEFVGEGASIGKINPSKVQIFPNPATDVINIANYEGLVSLYDLAGQLVMQTNASRIDVSGLNAGIYILRTATSSYKIVKQ